MSKVVYVDADGVWIANPDGSQAANIFSHTFSGRAAAATLSLDGKTVAFTVVSANLLGTLGILTSKPGDLSADKIQQALNIDIFLVDSDGKNLRQLTRNGLVALPCWSPDSRHLAYYGEDNTRRRSSGLFVIDVNGANNHEVVPLNTRAGLFIAGASSPAWSPDGSAIAYVDNSTPTGGNFTVMLVGTDGSNPHPLVKTGPFARLIIYAVSWSPDQQRIAVVAAAGTTAKAIYVASVDGTKLKLAAKDGMQSGFMLAGVPLIAWSADGTQVMFAGAIVRKSREPENAVYVVNTDGTHFHSAFAVPNILSVSWQTFPTGS